jgi:hypothetical protein
LNPHSGPPPPRNFRPARRGARKPVASLGISAPDSTPSPGWPGKSGADFQTEAARPVQSVARRARPGLSPADILHQWPGTYSGSLARPARRRSSPEAKTGRVQRGWLMSVARCEYKDNPTGVNGKPLCPPRSRQDRGPVAFEPKPNS